MTTQERTKRITKLEGLLRKAEGAGTEEERDAFMEGAMRLMEKWNIEEAELRLAGTSTEEISKVEFIYSTTDANLPGKRQLMSLACEIVGGVSFAYVRGMRHAQTGYFIGFERSIAEAQVVYSSLFMQAKSGAWRDGYTTKAQMTSYMMGFAAGAMDKLDDWREAQLRSMDSSLALVLVSRQDEVAAAMTELAGAPRTSNYRGDAAANSAGIAAGQEADLGQSKLG